MQDGQNELNEFVRPNLDQDHEAVPQRKQWTPPRLCKISLGETESGFITCGFECGCYSIS